MPIGLNRWLFVPLKNLGHISDKDYLFPTVCAKYEKVLPTHEVKIPFPQTPTTYKTYEERFYKHSEQMVLKKVRVLSNYSSSSFRQEGLRKSADNT